MKRVFFLMLGMLVAACILSACDSDTTTEDGDQDVMADWEAADYPDSDNSGDHEAADDPDTEAEDTEAPGRSVITGTTGFCSEPVSPDTSCNDTSDCTGIRIALPADCQSESVLSDGRDCRFVNRSAHPPIPECVGDTACRAYPRDCVNGQCVHVPPPDACGDNSDCSVVLINCACLAVSTDQANSYAPQLGDECQQGSCPQDATAICIEEHCRIAGAFMDIAIKSYCELMEDCGFLDTTSQQCEDTFKEQDYRMAAAQWPLLQSALQADTCQGFLFGPGKHLYECIMSGSE